MAWVAKTASFRLSSRQIRAVSNIWYSWKWRLKKNNSDRRRSATVIQAAARGWLIRFRSPHAYSYKCYVCDRANDWPHLLLCDECDERGCHTYCCGLEAVPSGEWCCDECLAL
jgi:hypothetical protein